VDQVSNADVDSAVHELRELLVDTIELSNAAYDRQEAARSVAERLTVAYRIPLQEVAERAGITVDSVENLLENSPMPLARRLRLDEPSIDMLLTEVAKRRRWSGIPRADYVARLHLDSVILRTLLTRAPVGFAILDPDLRFVLLNDALAEMNGVPAEEHIGRTIFDVVPGIAEEAAEPFRRVLGSGEPLLNLELTGSTVAEPGSRRTWYESVYRVTDNRGILGLAVVIVEMNQGVGDRQPR
jgi:PAS domain S-box-containing protein